VGYGNKQDTLFEELRAPQEPPPPKPESEKKKKTKLEDIIEIDEGALSSSLLFKLTGVLTSLSHSW